MRAVEKLASCDPIWSALRVQAEELAQSEPELASFAHATILKHDRLEDAIAYHLARKLGRRRSFAATAARNFLRSFRRR